MIRVRSTGMQNVRIGEELDITNIQHHMQRQTLAGLFQDLESIRLGIC